MTGSAASYEAGDHVGIYIENGTDIVEKVCRLLQHSPDTILQFKHPPGNPDRLAPCPTGVYQAGRSFPSCPWPSGCCKSCWADFQPERLQNGIAIQQSFPDGPLRVVKSSWLGHTHLQSRLALQDSELVSLVSTLPSQEVTSSSKALCLSAEWQPKSPWPFLTLLFGSDACPAPELPRHAHHFQG